MPIETPAPIPATFAVPAPTARLTARPGAVALTAASVAPTAKLTARPDPIVATFSVPATTDPATATPPNVIGGNDANTVLLLRFEGDDGSIAFVDEAVGGTAKTVDAIGTAAMKRA